MKIKNLGAFAPFIVIAALVVFAVFGGRLIGGTHSSQASQSEQFASENLTSIMSDPYKVSVPLGVPASALTIKALHSQNGSASGALKEVTNNLTFTSLNEKVAVVSPAGQITGVSVGTTTVTVTYVEGTVTKSCNVNVTITAAPTGT